ncbi:MAG: hypothetical protein PHU04_05480 [Candidatus Peribacteraceae bacterium]|nr:hypothetical protein [Candidatus Peribacteraceae bacterium]
MANTSIEKGKGAPEGNERQVIAVAQPQKLESLLDTIELLNTVSERMGESKSGDLGNGSGGTRQGAASQQSWRELAIASLPATPVMQRQLEEHIHTEIKTLRREMHRSARRAAKPGGAHKLNTLYARIRRLNGILQQLFSASVETIRRLYIRIFVDKQTAF